MKRANLVLIAHQPGTRWIAWISLPIIRTFKASIVLIEFTSDVGGLAGAIMRTV